MNVSIIIPIYNVAAYIYDCLYSVSQQTTTEAMECILVDDCGTDNSVELAEQFVKEYQGNISFIFIHHNRNYGLSAARNTGIKAARGEFLYFLDSDDELSPTCIEHLLSIAQKTKADMVQGSYEAISPFLRNFCRSLSPFIDNRSRIKHIMLDYDRFPVMAQNRLVKRNIIIEHELYFREGIIHEDNHWTYFLSKHLNSLAISSALTYIYKENPNSITKKTNKEKESAAFSTFITDFCANIDNVQPGSQKKLILNYLLTLLRSEYYNSQDERIQLILLVANIQNKFERLPFSFFVKTYAKKKLSILFYKILIFLYKIEDKRIIHY